MYKSLHQSEKSRMNPASMRCMDLSDTPRGLEAWGCHGPSGPVERSRFTGKETEMHGSGLQEAQSTSEVSQEGPLYHTLVTVRALHFF